MTAIDLASMSLKDLKKLRKQVDAEIEGFKDRKKAEALAELEAKAREMGYSLSELTGKRAKKAPAPAKYRNPKDAAQTWSGRGRQPEWFKSAIKSGTAAEALEI